MVIINIIIKLLGVCRWYCIKTLHPARGESAVVSARWSATASVFCRRSVPRVNDHHTDEHSWRYRYPNKHDWTIFV